MVAQCVSKNQRLLREIVTSSDLGFNVDLGADGAEHFGPWLVHACDFMIAMLDLS